MVALCSIDDSIDLFDFAVLTVLAPHRPAVTDGGQTC